MSQRVDSASCLYWERPHLFYAIGLRTAKEIGLPAEAADKDLDELMWQLLLEYERDLKLLEPLDPATAVSKQDTYVEPAVIAVIETSESAHEFTGNIVISAQRQMPQSFNVALNLNLMVPPALQGVAGAPAGQQAAFQQAMQQLLQQAQQVVLQQAQQSVQEALRQQAPLMGIEAAFRYSRWLRVP